MTLMNCEICNKKITSFKELTTHLMKGHNLSIKEVYDYFGYSFVTRKATCPICGTTFKITPKQAWKFKNDETTSIGCCKNCSLQIRSLTHESPFANKEVREKAKKTIKEKYGVECSLQSSAIREKAKETIRQKYGVENVSQSAEIQEKVKQTNLKKYGVERPSQSEEIRRKTYETNLKRYGVEHPMQVKEVVEKIQNTNLERYGVKNASSAPEVKEKRKKTMNERYGVDYVSQVPKFIKKAHEIAKATNLKRYGAEHPMQTEEIKENMRKTNTERYGNEYTINTPEFTKKAKRTNLERYGYENAYKNKDIQEKARQTNLKRYGHEYASQSTEIMEKIKQVNMEKYGVEFFCQHEKCSAANGFRISKINKEFHELLSQNGIENELEFIVGNLGYDLKVGDTLIEIDPYFTHNSTVGPYFGGKQRESISEDYHLNKTNTAKEHDFNCIHIFDWDEWGKVIYLLQPKSKVYARECEVREMGNREAREFLNTYHLQSSTKQVQYAYGLYYNKELVEVMTFGKPRYNKNYEYELLRLCSTPRFNIIGGASKLLKCFETKVKPKSIISYCDLSKFNGNVYEKLGFTLKERTKPAKHWYNPKTKKHITDNLLRQRGFDQLHKTSFGRGTSNEQLMLEHGYVEIFDCGQLVFTKQFPNSNNILQI